jgi:hypothetical protein
MSEDNLESTVKQFGFDNAADFHKHVAAVDLSTPDKFKQFKAWQFLDGSKEGLLKLPVREP